jgi:HAD superfamily hydrolase (TIGR01662 family)
LARFWTNELQRPIVVVTNQSGIGRGYFDENAYAALMQWMCDRFEAEGTAITRTYHYPYHPLDGIGEYRCDHPWRKPKPGMLMQAVSDLGLDAAKRSHCSDLTLLRPRLVSTPGIVDLSTNRCLNRAVP